MASNRQPVAKGGLWSSHAAPVSPQTQDLLKTMMEDSKLTNFQRRQLKENMKKGAALPVTCNPSSSESQIPKPGGSPKKPLPKVMNARHLSRGVRTKDTIDEQQAKQGKVVPVPLKGKFISAKDKRRLQNVMAYGEYGKDLDEDKRRPRRPPPEGRDEPEVDRFEEVLQEIEERQQFLEEMESMGQGQKYQTIIETEISQHLDKEVSTLPDVTTQEIDIGIKKLCKVRELELIDKARTEELNVAMKEQE